MAVRALAIDLGGTLLGAHEEVSPRNRRALLTAIDAGIHVVVATARWVHLAQRVAVTLGLDGPVIACSGAEVKRLRDGEDLMDVRLPREFADALHGICDHERCIAWFAMDDDVLMKIDGEVPADLFPSEVRRVPSLASAIDAAPRIALIQGTRVGERIRAELEPEWKDRIRFVTSVTTQGKEILTLTSQGADKGVALGVACRELGIAPSDVVAFGDAENDIELFEAAGASFAMGQASPEVKAAATHKTGTNLEDGVAQGVERILQGELGPILGL